MADKVERLQQSLPTGCNTTASGFPHWCHMDSHRLAWAAGVFDGEGCVHINKGQYTLAVSLKMTCELTVRRFYLLFGCGSIQSQQPKGNARKQWMLRVSGKEAVFVIKALRPYLFTKSRQADLALEYGEKCLDASTVEIKALREVLYEELCELNKRGN